MPVNKDALIEGMTLTEMLHDAIKNDNKKWHKDHVKAFFKSRLKKPLNDASAIAVLTRASALEGMKTEKINGKKFVSNAVSNEAMEALNKFLYGKSKC